MSWDDIPDEPYYSSRTRKQLRAHFQMQHPWRWRRIQKDYAWLKKEMTRMGLNGEDARFIL